MSELLQTPLYDMHLEAGAKLVPFAGYMMPVQYPPGIKSEHLHTRSAAGLFDVSHMGQAIIEGQTAARDLQRLLPLDLQELPPNHSQYTFLPNAEGGIIDDLIVTCRGPESYFVVFNAACKASDIAHFRQHLSATAELRLLQDYALLALQGPQAAAVMTSLVPQAAELVFMSGCEARIGAAECYITRSGYTGEDGFEISVPAAAAPALAQALLNHSEVNWIGLGARDSLRLEAGLCLYGHDMDAQRSPVDAGLMWSVGKSRRQGAAQAGNFIGAERIFARQNEGPQEKRVGLRVEGKAPVREGADIVDADGLVIGRVSSGGFAPSLGAPIAMGYVKTEYTALGSTVAAMVRGKPLAMTVCKMPFVPQRYFRGK